MNNGKIVLRPRELFFAAFIFLFPLQLYLEVHYHLQFIAYTDEILCIISMLYLLYYQLIYKKGFVGKELVFIILVLVLSVIGFAGNLFSKVTDAVFPILVDFIALGKILFPFLAYLQIAKQDKDFLMFTYLAPFCKLLILTGTIFGVLSIFVDIGMSGEERYGLRSYYFIFGPNGGSRYGFIVFCCLLILAFTKMPIKKYRIYEVLAIFNIILITKGASLVLAIVYVVLMLMWRYSKTYKFSMSNIIAISVAGIALSTYQINTYIKDPDSPRMMLIRYGAITANQFFPLGAGFATYGSDQAAKSYSQLYYQYGFNMRFGLSPSNPSFLNDGYLGMLLGELGWIGTVIFIALIVIMFKYVNKTGVIGKYEKAATFAIYIALLVSALGTAIIKSNIGVMCIVVLGTICGYAQRIEYENNKAENSQ